MVGFDALAVFLHPDNLERFAFERKGRKRIAGIDGVELDFEETGRPTYVQGKDFADLPAKGRFWIDPRQGTVLRTEVRFDFGPGTARVTTEYRRERHLAMWVPSEMEESYTRLRALARYSNFRRFGVSIEESARLPEGEEP